MGNSNTNQTVDYSQTRVLELMRGMTPEDQRTLARFVDAMVHEGLSSAYATLTPKQRLDALSDAVSRMKSHSVVLSQFFTRSSTKQAALEGMNQEIENMLVLWELVKADLEVQS
ncbi:hypothetical protein [Thiothrix subterranea]|uniref:Uncharacterized protein n=1 Tax=Thiothrix subterranea TaxID=2735563 RepID=A0AA51QYH7_9GAMM|nr:hypothetical protein [Thiothrix subterranea]MDQ5770975.1 hypothetical protein [Thiothrix subterranea]WML85987.1 hypothetical protein RCG00_17005 [Thiothrix subterranea]